MPTYKVFYAKDLTAIYRGDARFSDATHDLACSVEAPDLEGVFEKLNSPEFVRTLLKLHIRSMSAGDVAVDEEGVAHMCMLAGWSILGKGVQL